MSKSFPLLEKQSDREVLDVGLIVQGLARLNARNRFITYVRTDRDPRETKWWSHFSRIRDRLHEHGCWKRRKECLAAVYGYHGGRFHRTPYLTQLASDFAITLWKKRCKELDGGAGREIYSLSDGKEMGHKAQEQVLESLRKETGLTQLAILKKPQYLVLFTRKFLWNLPEFKHLLQSGFYIKEFGCNPFDKEFNVEVNLRRVLP